MNTEHPNNLRVVLDTNIYASALNFGGKPSSVIAFGRNGDCSVFISTFILEELRDVLKVKFGWDEKIINEEITLITELAATVNSTERVTEIFEDESDNRILECALACHANYIVSGDRHVLKLRRRSVQLTSLLRMNV